MDGLLRLLPEGLGEDVAASLGLQQDLVRYRHAHAEEAAKLHEGVEVIGTPRQKPQQAGRGLHAPAGAGRHERERPRADDDDHVGRPGRGHPGDPDPERRVRPARGGGLLGRGGSPRPLDEELGERGQNSGPQRQVRARGAQQADGGSDAQALDQGQGERGQRQQRGEEQQARGHDRVPRRVPGPAERLLDLLRRRRRTCVALRRRGGDGAELLLEAHEEEERVVHVHGHQQGDHHVRRGDVDRLEVAPHVHHPEADEDRDREVRGRDDQQRHAA
mmetsp:Transcript_78150/g.201249  ORF Transcript_78150/g.201249 Transcript_78150/m.201249 type:complete len:275 (-) Transcript_78150:664-1488(-)